MTVFFAYAHFMLAMAFGGLCLRRSGFRFDSKLENAGFAFALGYGFLGYFIYFLGLMGLLQIELFLIFYGFLLLLLISEIVLWLKAIGQRLKAFVQEVPRHPKETFLIGWTAVILFVSLWLCLLPPTAHDALCYHINIPKRFVQAYRIVYLPYLINSLFPFLIQMHYTLALLLNRPELTSIFHYLCGVGTWIGIFALSRRDMNTFYSLLAGLVFLLTPGIFNQMIIPYNDVALALFTFFGFYSLIMALNRPTEKKWFALMGIYTGFALSIKYLALIHMAVIVFVFIIMAMKNRLGGKDFITKMALYGFFSTLFSFIWYLRSYLHEGNPVYPFFPGLFGGTGKDYDLAKAGFGKMPVDFILAIWRITMHPERFGGTWAQVGVTFLSFAPLIFLRLVREKNGRVLGLLALVFCTLWFYLIQNARFLFPIIPILSILVAMSAQEFVPFLLILLVMNTGFVFYHAKDAYGYLLGRQNAAQYLLRHERTFELSQWMNANLPATSIVLNAEEVRMFYLNPAMIREGEFRRRTQYDELAKTPEDAAEFLRKENITHILLTVSPQSHAGKIGAMNLRNLAGAEDFRRRHLQLLYEQSVQGDDGEYRYRVFQFKN